MEPRSGQNGVCKPSCSHFRNNKLPFHVLQCKGVLQLGSHLWRKILTKLWKRDDGTMTSPPRDLRSNISQWPPPHFQSRALLRWGWQWGRCIRLTSFRCGWDALQMSSTKRTDSNTKRNTWRSYKIKTLQNCKLWTQTNPSFWTCGQSTSKYETWLSWPFSCWNSQGLTYTQLFHIKMRDPKKNHHYQSDNSRFQLLVMLVASATLSDQRPSREPGPWPFRDVHFANDLRQHLEVGNVTCHFQSRKLCSLPKWWCEMWLFPFKKETSFSQR